jgi:hypothetical protein
MDGVIIANLDKPVKLSAALAEHYVRGALRSRVNVLGEVTLISREMKNVLDRITGLT